MTSAVSAPPSRLGRFEVGAKIGGGGMAKVYIGRALKADGSDELVALKVIRDEYANDERFNAMFTDEAKILARLSHPNVIHTLEFGTTGVHRFIAMELLEGRTFADVWETLVERGEAVPLRLGAWICARVAEGLHSAHELTDESGAPLGVIHRDVNPGNIFLTLGGLVKLIDFGLAKARVRTFKTDAGVVKGKIPYLAPEQAQIGPIDRRVDVYALGTTLWESSTMKRLFKRDNDVLTLKAIMEAVVPDVRTMVPGFPDELWAIIDKALQRDREARFATAEEMQKALDAFVGDASDLPKELAGFIARLFPDLEDQYAKWQHEAISVRIPKMTLPPPGPVPTSSSTLLEETSKPEVTETEEASPAPKKKKKSKRSSSRPPPPQKKKKKKRSKKYRDAAGPRAAAGGAVERDRDRDRDRDREVGRGRDHDDPRPKRFWVWLAVVAAIALVVAYAASR